MKRAIVVGLVWVLFVQVGIAERLASGGTRILHFPTDRSIGTLYVAEEMDRFVQYDSKDEYLWDYYGEAIGDLVVNSDIKLELRPNQRNLIKNLSALSSLGPNDLYKLTIFKRTDDKSMPYIARLTGLKELVLTDTKITKDGMDFIKQLKSLKKLTLVGAFSGSSLIHLQELKSLENLTIAAPITEDDILLLEKLPSLKKLAIGNRLQMGGKAIMNLTKIPGLEYLEFGTPNFNNDNLKYLRDAKSLKKIVFKNQMPITNVGLKHLSTLKGLEMLEICEGPITNKGVAYIASLNSLKRLQLCCRIENITNEAMVHVSQLKELESLDLPSTIIDAGLAEVSKLTNLRRLWVGGSSLNPISDKGLEYISRLSNLEVLFVGGKNITNKGVEHISKLKNLKRLEFFHTSDSQPVNDIGLQYLKKLKSVKRLRISGKFTISGLSNLNELSNLTELEVGEIIQDDSALNISGLKDLKRLRFNIKGDQTIQDEDLICLANLKKLEKFVILSDSRKGTRAISNAGMAHLKDLTCLQQLWIGGPDLTDDGLKYLANLKKLLTLAIFGNFTDEGLHHLESLTSLRRLFIYSKNDISQQALNELKIKLPNLNEINVMKYREKSKIVSPVDSGKKPSEQSIKKSQE